MKNSVTYVFENQVNMETGYYRNGALVLKTKQIFRPKSKTEVNRTILRTLLADYMQQVGAAAGVESNELYVRTEKPWYLCVEIGVR